MKILQEYFRRRWCQAFGL